jgi:hypothetical protein
VKYIGLDCHKHYDFATLIDSETGEIRSKKLAHKKDESKAFIGDRSKSKMVRESCRRKPFGKARVQQCYPYLCSIGLPAS